MKDSDYVKTNSLNPSFLVIDKVDGYIEESKGNKYLILASPDKSKEELTKHTKLWDEIKYLIKTINGGEAGEYEREYKKIRLESNDNLAFE